jgi:hypothetical protein
VTAVVFDHESGFFLPSDKVQVKYEMPRARVVAGMPVSTAEAQHGYPRASLYLVAAAFDVSGMLGLLDERRGRRGRFRLTPEIVVFLCGRTRHPPFGTRRRAARHRARPPRAQARGGHHRTS